MKKLFFAAMTLFFLLPSFAYPKEILVFFNDLVPQISDEKRLAYEIDKDFFQNEIKDKLKAVVDTDFWEKISEESDLILTGKLYSYDKGILCSTVVYVVYLASAPRNIQLKPDLYAKIFLEVNWVEGTPLDEVLKPEIRRCVDSMIKTITKK